MTAFGQLIFERSHAPSIGIIHAIFGIYRNRRGVLLDGLVIIIRSKRLVAESDLKNH